DQQAGGDGADRIALGHHRQAVAPAGGLGDHHVRHQAAMRLGQVRVGAVLQRRGLLASAGGEGEAENRDGGQGMAVHFTSPMRGLLKPSQAAITASTTTTTDSTRPPGMLAQASRACISALKKPTTQVASSSTKCRTDARVRLDAARPKSAHTSESASTTRPLAISQDAKLFHWIS